MQERPHSSAGNSIAAAAVNEAQFHQTFVHKLRSTIQSREYLKSRELCNSYAETNRNLKMLQLEELERQHSLERLRLHQAKEIAMMRAKSAGAEKVRDAEVEMGQRQRNLQSAHDDKLHVFTMLTREKEERKPVVYSTLTNSLRQSEKHLARLHMFEEAALAKQKLEQREAAEAARLLRNRERKIRDLEELKKSQYIDEERTLYTRMKGGLQVQKNLNAVEVQRVAATYDHLAEDMSRAHYRQQMECTKTTTLDLETALKNSSGQLSRCTRGSTMLRKIKGNRFTIPSLCDLYGDLLDAPRSHGKGSEVSR